MNAIEPLYPVPHAALENCNRWLANAVRMGDPRWWAAAYCEHMNGLARLGWDALEVHREGLYFMARLVAHANEVKAVNAAEEVEVGMPAAAWKEAMEAARAVRANGMLRVLDPRLEAEALAA